MRAAMSWNGGDRRRWPAVGSPRAAILVLLLAFCPGMLAAQQSESVYAGRALFDVLEDLRSRGLRLIYSSDVVRSDMTVESEPPAAGLREILVEILEPHGLEVREGPGGTLLIVSPEEPLVMNGCLRGSVRTLEGGWPVAAARIRAVPAAENRPMPATESHAEPGAVDGSGLHPTKGESVAMSDRAGLFEFPALPEGRYDLEVAVPGLDHQRFTGVEVRGGECSEATLDLRIEPHVREKVVVTPPPPGAAGEHADPRRVLEAQEIDSSPAVGDDMHRALAWQPGVASGDLSAEMNVRGGDSDELLVMLDGMEISNPFHLNMFHSFSGIIDSRAIGRADLLTGAFPVEYGDRMSGVMDLTSSIPSGNGRTVIAATALNSSVYTDGRFAAGAGHWLVSGRAWYPDEVVRTVDREDEGFAPAYYDLLGKMEMQVGRRTVLSGNILAAADAVDFIDLDAEERVDADSTSQYAWLNLRTLWTPKIYSRTLFSIGRVRSDRAGRIANADEVTAAVDDRRTYASSGVGQDWSYEPTQRFLLKWGAGARWLEADYDYISRSATGDPTEPPPARVTDLEQTGQRFSAYIGGRIRPVRPLTIEMGVRWDRQSYVGGSQVSPRVNVVQMLGASSTLRAGWGRFYQSQGLHELQVEDGVQSFFPAQLAEHWSLGFEHNFAGGVRLRVDAYLKEMSDLRPRYENFLNSFELLPEFDEDRVLIAPDRAEASGIDLSLGRDPGRGFGWWASYTRSTIEDEIDGEMIPRSWDQPHAFNLALRYRGNGLWSMALAGAYHTGWPTTGATGEPVDDPGGTQPLEPVFGPRNGERFSDYIRVDLKAVRHIPLGRGRLNLFVEVTNLLDRKNACCVEDVYLSPGPGGGVNVAREESYWLQRVPSIGISWEITH